MIRQLAFFMYWLLSITGILTIFAWVMASTLQGTNPMPAGTLSATLAQDGIWMLGNACMAVGLLILLTERFVFKHDGA